MWGPFSAKIWWSSVRRFTLRFHLVLVWCEPSHNLTTNVLFVLWFLCEFFRDHFCSFNMFNPSCYIFLTASVLVQYVRDHPNVQTSIFSLNLIWWTIPLVIAVTTRRERSSSLTSSRLSENCFCHSNEKRSCEIALLSKTFNIPKTFEANMLCSTFQLTMTAALQHDVAA